MLDRRGAGRWRGAACSVASAVLVISGCSRTPAPTASQGASTQAAAGALQPLTLPELARVDESVRQQLHERYDALQRLLKTPAASDADKAAAFGGLAVLLHAAEFYEAAQPAYENAQQLAPQEPKWPYLLAHLHKSRGEPGNAENAFTRALSLSPNDPAALIWLGRLYLDQGEADKAQPLFERARTAAPDAVAALVGLGQAALARRDFTKAVEVLEEALRVSPSAASVHSPLAMAYRGLGDTARAEAHIKQWRNTEVLVPDPVRQELDLALQSSLSFELRGVRALEARDYEAAVRFFTQGVQITDGSTMLGRSLRHKLGTALYMTGNLPAAVARFRETVRLAPADGRDESAAKAHYSLGILAASAGLGPLAIEHLTAAVRYNPDYVEGGMALADALRRAGRPADALTHYKAVLALNPRAMDAAVGYGMGLVQLRRYAEARRWFEEALTAQPDVLELRFALARLLSAAPDDKVRDGTRGLQLMRDILASASERTTSIGEAYAMALAETGDFTQAAAVQRDVITAASNAGLTADTRRMTRNLALFERKRPCREPWAPDDPVFSPGPPVDPGLRAVLQPSPR